MQDKKNERPNLLIRIFAKMGWRRIALISLTLIYLLRNILKQNLFSENSQVGSFWEDKQPELPSQEKLFYQQNQESDQLHGRSYVLLKLVVLLLIVYAILRKVNSR